MAADAAADEDPTGGDFDSFLDEAVILRAGSRITTARIWNAWAGHYGADPDSDYIAGVHKGEVARRFRAHFSAPRASRGRVDGPVEYYWDDYDIARSSNLT